MKDIEQLKQKILDLAIRGKLFPQDPNDEPASVLLERIQKEKEQMVKDGKIKKSKDDSLIYKGSDNRYYEKKNEMINELSFSHTELGDDYVVMRLGSIGLWGSGSTPKRTKKDYYFNGTIPWLKTGELNNGFIYDCQEKITEKALKECSLRIVNVDDVLIAMYGATIGKLGIAKCKLTTNQACCACTPFSFINSEYLFYYLMLIKKEFVKKSFGGAQPNISKEKIESSLIFFPSLSKQIMIVDLIKRCFVKLNKIKDEIISIEKYREQLKKRVLEYFFSPSDKSHYENRTKLSIKNIIPECNIGDGDWVLSEDMNEKGPVRLVQLKHIGNGEFINKPYQTMTEDFCKRKKASFISSGFLLISRLLNGSMNVCLLPKLPFRTITSVDVCWISPNNSISLEYLQFYLLSPIIQKEVMNSSSGSTRKRISKKNLENINLMVHSRTAQIEIVKTIKELFSKIDSICH